MLPCLPCLPSTKLPQKRKNNGPKVMPRSPKTWPYGSLPCKSVAQFLPRWCNSQGKQLGVAGKFYMYKMGVPSREPTYPTGGKGKSSSKVPFWGDMLVPRRVIAGKEQRLNKNSPTTVGSHNFIQFPRSSHLAQRILEFFSTQQ